MANKTDLEYMAYLIINMKNPLTKVLALTLLAEGAVDPHIMEETMK